MRTRSFEGVFNIYQELKMQSQFVEAHRDISTHGDTVQLHSHSFYELLYICSGKIEYLLGTERCEIQKGDVIIIPPNLSHRPLFTMDMDGRKYERIAVWLSTAFADSCKDLLSEFSVSRARASETHQAAEKGELLDDVIYFIDIHLSEKISLEETARYFYVSQSALSKLFRSRLNESFYQYVTQRRLIAAKQLVYRGLSLNQASEQAGFMVSPIQYKELIRQ